MRPEKHVSHLALAKAVKLNGTSPKTQSSPVGPRHAFDDPPRKASTDPPTAGIGKGDKAKRSGHFQECHW